MAPQECKNVNKRGSLVLPQKHPHTPDCGSDLRFGVGNVLPVRVPDWSDISTLSSSNYLKHATLMLKWKERTLPTILCDGTIRDDGSLICPPCAIAGKCEALSLSRRCCNFFSFLYQSSRFPS